MASNTLCGRYAKFATQATHPRLSQESKKEDEMYTTYGNIKDLNLGDLERLNEDPTLPESTDGAILVIEDVPTQYPSGPGTFTWYTSLLLDQDGNIVARNPNRRGEVQVRLKLGQFSQKDWEKAKETAIWWAANTSPIGTYVSDETEAGKRFNEYAEWASELDNEV